MYDICVIGGGAAGMCAAITAARKGKKVIIIEKNTKLGRKLYATGNGKCNLTNIHMDYSKTYHSSDKNYVFFLHEVMGDTPDSDVKSFFSSIGIPTYTTTDGYVYPAASQASAVVWALSDALASEHVEITCNTEITDIQKSDIGYKIMASDKIFQASKVILTCGGCSYPSLGGTKSGYVLAQKFGHSIQNIHPALCALVSKDVPVELAGIRVPATATLLSDNATPIASHSGELQITDYGLSGIMIFNLAAKAGDLLAAQKSVWISLNLIPCITHHEFEELYKTAGHRTVIGLLNGFLHDKLAAYVIKEMQLDRKTRVSDISLETLHRIVKKLTDLRFLISDTNGYEKAQVCAGGISLDEINPVTCESKLSPGLYFAGEVLDIDGICGGYNLTYAITSGIRAGESCV